VVLAGVGACLLLYAALVLVLVTAGRRERARYPKAAVRWVSRFLEETADASLEEVQVVTAALASLPSAPELARPVLRELIRHRRLSTMASVFSDFVEA
jgi:hypothetical protein